MGIQTVCHTAVCLKRSQLEKHWQSSFPVTHKVGNIDIFVQLLMEINLKQEHYQFHDNFTFVIVHWIIIEVMNGPKKAPSKLLATLEPGT